MGPYTAPFDVASPRKTVCAHPALHDAALPCMQRCYVFTPQGSTAAGLHSHKSTSGAALPFHSVCSHNNVQQLYSVVHIRSPTCWLYSR
jgi:hypothetical protein